MNNKTYITALDISSFSNTTSPITSGKSTSRIYNFKKLKKLPQKKQLAKSSSAKEIQQKYKHQQTLAIRLKQNFLDFLIQEQTNFANLDQVYSFYSERAIENRKRYNDNLIKIQKLKEEEDELHKVIYVEVLKNYPIQKTALETYYDSKISKLNSIVSIYNHNLDCYQNMYKRLYKANYLVKKRMEEEMKYDTVSQKQFEKYEILNNHALQTVKKQSSMLKNVQNFIDLTQATYKAEIMKKTKQFNELEFQVFTLKKDTNEIELKIQRLKNEQDELKKTISLRNEYNIKNLMENQTYLQEYFSSKVKLNNIYEILKVKSLEEIINKFNNLQKEYVSYCSMFAKINSEIANLNFEYSELELLLQETKLKVNLLQTNSTYDELKADTEVIEVKEEKEILSQQYESVKKETLKYEQLIKIVLLYIVNYTNKIKNSMRLSYLPHYFSYRSHYNIKKKFKKFYEFNENTKSYSLKPEKVVGDLGKNGLHFCIVIFNDFIESVFLILSNALNLVCAENMDSSSLTISNACRNFQVVPYGSLDILKSFEKNVKNAFSHYERKIQIYGRSDKDIFDNKKSNKPIKKLERHRKMSKVTTIEELYKHFITRFCKDPLLKHSRYIKYHPMRSISIVRKYANENVFDSKKKLIRNLNRAQSTADIRSGQSTKRLTQISQSKNEGITGNKSFSINQDIFKDYNYEFDSDEELYEEVGIDNKKNKKRKEKLPNFMVTTNDPQKDIIYTRMNDIRKLELHYHQDLKGGKASLSTKQVNNDEFNEIYYNFKKKFLKKEPILFKNKSKSVSTIHSKVSSRKSSNKLMGTNSNTNNSNKKDYKSSNNHFVSGSTSAMNKTGMSVITYNQSSTSNIFGAGNPTSNTNNNNNNDLTFKDKILVNFK